MLRLRKVADALFLSLKNQVNALVLTATLSACGGGISGTGDGTERAKQTLIYAANEALTNEDCNAAINYIEQLYDSGQTDNTVRMIRASAHACNAELNYFSLINDLATNDLGNASSGFSSLWSTITKIFYSSDLNTLDTRVQSGWFATDALMAVLNKPATVIPESKKINSTTDNPGSISYLDREEESNTYMILVSMALIGAIHNRYGAPNSGSYKKTTDLGVSALKPVGWVDVNEMDSTGCSYAAAILNMIDGLKGTSALTDSLSALTQLESLFGIACTAGCMSATAEEVSVLGSSFTYAFTTNCTFTDAEAIAFCSSCPIDLRNRASCESDTPLTSIAACSAAGIINFINQDPSHGWLDND